MKTFHAIATGHNCEPFVVQTIESIRAQQIPDGWQLLIHAVDDHSNDGTFAKLRGVDSPTRSVVRLGAAYHRQQIIRSDIVKPDDVVFLIGLDGDMLTDDALRIVAMAYDEHGADLTYGSWRFTSGGCWDHGPYPKSVIEAKSYRHHPWKCAPLQTFRAHLAKDLSDKWFTLPNGQWLPACTELALLYPVLERCTNPVFISHILYLYNRTANNTRRMYGRKKREWKKHLDSMVPWSPSDTSY